MRWELLALGAVGLLTVLGCLLPNRLLPPLPNDKLMHFAAFGVLTLLATRLAAGPAAAWLAAGALLLAGWLIEYLQNWVPGRHFSWADLAANTAGIACALALTGGGQWGYTL